MGLSINFWVEKKTDNGWQFCLPPLTGEYKDGDAGGDLDADLRQVIFDANRLDAELTESWMLDDRQEAKNQLAQNFVEWNLGRHYQFFAILGESSRYHEPVTPIHPRRDSFPPNCSNLIVREAADFCQGSKGWYTLAELLDYDWSQCEYKYIPDVVIPAMSAHGEPDKVRCVFYFS